MTSAVDARVPVQEPAACCSPVCTTGVSASLTFLIDVLVQVQACDVWVLSTVTADVAACQRNVMEKESKREPPPPRNQRYQRCDARSCERVVLGKSAKVLIGGSAQGICPPHRGR